MKQKGWKMLRDILITICCLTTLCLAVGVAVYFPQVSKVVQTLALIDQKFLWESDADTLADGAVRGMLESLEDKYTTYIDEEQMAGFMEQISGDVYGIGVYVSENEDGQYIIVGTIEEGPAEAVGIQAGDILAAVDGVSVEALTFEQAIAKMRGKEGESVEVSVTRNGEPLDFTVVRYKIGTTTTVSGEILPQDEQIAYVRIREFSLHTATEFADQVNALEKEGFQGMILDLRDNGGGEVNAAVEVARVFVPSGPIVHVVAADGSTDTKNATQAQLELPLVVLVNENTASASEILSGALKDSGVATLVGTKTFGKGLVQGVYLYQDGTAMKITEAKYLTPKQNDINGLGIQPDVVVELPADATEDVQLNRAIQLLQKQLP